MRFRKTIFLILFILPLCVFSQKASYTEIHITKEKLVNAKNIRDIITGQPNDCKLSFFQTYINPGSGMRTMLYGGENLADNFIKEVGKIKKRKYFVIEIKDCSCLNSNNSSFKIFVD